MENPTEGLSALSTLSEVDSSVASYSLFQLSTQHKIEPDTALLLKNAFVKLYSAVTETQQNEKSLLAKASKLSEELKVENIIEDIY